MRYVVSTAFFAVFLLLGGCGGGGETVAGNGGSGGDGSETLAAPQSLQVTAENGAVDLQWLGVEGADGYALYHATEGGIQPTNFGIWMSQHAGVMIENVTSPHTVEGLANGTEYFFVVTATAGDQESDPSNEVSAIPRAPDGTGDGSVREPVLLEGEASTPAVSATVDFSPIAAPDDEVAPDGFMLTRLSALLHPAATVGQVNAALQDADARISFMRSGSLTVTLMVPRHATLDEAQTLSDALKQTGAFLGVSPAWSPTVIPPEVVESDSSTVLMMVEPEPILLLPGGEADSNIAHLKAIAMPSAWNLRRLAFDNGVMVPVLVPDGYVRDRTSTQISNLTFVTHRATTASPVLRRVAGNHGWHVAGTIGADFDDARSTGVHPGAQPGGGSPIFRIDAFAVLGVGLAVPEMYAEIVDQFPASGPFVINTSFGWRMDKVPTRTQRRHLAHESLALRARTSADEARFVVAASAGNDRGLDARYNSVQIANASFDDVREIVTNPDDLAELEELLAWYQATYPDVDFMARSRNVLAVGSSRLDGSPSGFTNSIAYVPPGIGVQAVGTNVFGPCAKYEPGDPDPKYCSADDGDVVLSGTSMAAPQVAGLAAYMWNLNPSLSSSEIVRAVAQTYRNGLINAYEASLAAGGLAARRALLDVNDDGRFDHEDLHEILTQWSTGISPLSFSRYDLNGSGRPGGVTRARFDLDGDGAYGAVHVTIGAVTTVIDESAVTDTEVLCYYAYGSDLYEGAAFQRDEILASICGDADAGGVLTLRVTEAVLGGPFDHFALEVCDGVACENVTPRHLGSGLHAVDLPADTDYDVHVSATGYVDALVSGVRLAPGETASRAVALTVDVSLVVDSAITTSVLDALTDAELVGVSAKLRSGVNTVDGDPVDLRDNVRSPVTLYVWSLPAGYYTVEVSHPDYESDWWSIALPFGSDRLRFVRRLAPLPVDDLLEIGVDATETSVRVGNSLSFDVTIGNRWTNAVDAVTIRIEVNGDVTLQAAPDGCTYEQGTASGVFTCALAEPLAGGASLTLPATVRVESIDQGSSIIIGAQITGWSGPADPNPSNNEDSTFVLIELDDPPVLTSIEVTPVSAEVARGGSLDFTATAFDQFGNVLPGVAVAWTSSHPCVAAVDGFGRATAVGAPGTSTIRASSGDVSGNATLTVPAATSSAPASVAGTWIVCNTSTGEFLLTLNLQHEAGQAAVTGGVMMANGAQSQASGSWQNDVLSVSWLLLVQGGERTFSIVNATPRDEQVLIGRYNDRFLLTTYDVDVVRVP